MAQRNPRPGSYFYMDGSWIMISRYDDYEACLRSCSIMVVHEIALSLFVNIGYGYYLVDFHNVCFGSWESHKPKYYGIETWARNWGRIVGYVL